MGIFRDEDGFFNGAGGIWQARQRIGSLVRKTPLLHSAAWSERFRASIYLKMECWQPTHSFKIRGAASRILGLKSEEKKRGVATFSTGNHGLAVAYLAGKLKIPVKVFLSARVPAVKVENLRRLGAEPVVHGDSQDEAEVFCKQEADKEGWTVINPFDDPHIIAGQGTIGLELLEQLPEVDTVVVPVSGGGLISGLALALKSNLRRVKVIGVSMEGSAVMYHSLQAGHPVEMKETGTLADSLLGGIGLDNRYTFKLVQEYVDDLVLVGEEAIAGAMGSFFYDHRLVVEGAAATGLAALEEHQLVEQGSRVVLVVSGNSVDPREFMKIISL